MRIQKDYSKEFSKEELMEMMKEDNRINKSNFDLDGDLRAQYNESTQKYLNHMRSHRGQI